MEAQNASTEEKSKTKERTHRRTRIVCVSDTHGYTPSQAGFKLPPGDVLIHAGDLTNQGSMSELRRTIEWISKADYEVKIVVAGNHDITLNPEFYAEHGSRFHNQSPESPEKCIELLKTASPSVIFLNHSSATIRLTKRDGPRTVFKVFGSPYSRFRGNWAFGYESADAQKLWSQIPLDTDIVVTHTPPHSHCDQLREGVSVGCEGLREALRKVRPMLAVCGHVHEGRGYERVRWDISSSPDSDNAPGEEETERGILAPIGSKKQSLVDLTGKKQRRLDNSGCAGYDNQVSAAASTPSLGDDQIVPPIVVRPPSVSRIGGSFPGMPMPLSENAPERHDHVEYEGRQGRKETCIVNAAIMATSWPHKGGKKFHAPIVIDMELPIWNEDPET